MPARNPPDSHRLFGSEEIVKVAEMDAICKMSVHEMAQKIGLDRADFDSHMLALAKQCEFHIFALFDVRGFRLTGGASSDMVRLGALIGYIYGKMESQRP